MNTEIIAAENMESIEDIPSVLKRIFSEEPVNAQQLDSRWRKGFSAIFSSIAGAVSHFLVSHIKTKEVEAIQSYIRHFFWKTNIIEEIKNDYHQQNAFLLGYCHGINEIIDSFESEISYEKNEEVKAVIASYRHVTPILKILETKFELSHKELAESLDISESALSNLMKKIKKHHLFNETRMGKNKFYSIAYPNGEEALKIIKEDNKISADGYTKLLLKMMDALIKISTRDEVGKDYAIKECEKMIWEYTTQPALCRQKLDELAFISHSERIYYNSLIILEMGVKEKVTVFTRDFRSEENFYRAIIENLKNNIQYQWFITETEEHHSIEEIKENFFGKLRVYIGLADEAWEKLKDNMQCYSIPQSKTESLLGEIYDAVIYDEDEGFSCVDRTIKDKTPYIRMDQNKIEELNQYVRERTRTALSFRKM